MLDWAEKYRPKNLREVVGNNEVLEEIRKWAVSWEKGIPKKKGIIFVGGPGIGKTSSAIALANDFGWGVIELNASDQRNYEKIKRIAMFGAVYETFTDNGDFILSKEGGRKLIILDEADNLFGNEDKGGMRAIVETIRNTKQPVVLIVNDYYELTRKSGIIKNLCLTVKFENIKENNVKHVLKDICEKENIEISFDALEKISQHSNGDLRSAINDLQSLSAGRKKVSAEDTVTLGNRDLKTTIFKALSDIFKSKDIEKSRNAVLNLDETPDYLILWLDENLPLEYRDAEDLKNAYEKLSRADVFLGRIRKRQYYGLWGYANNLMTAGVSVAKNKSYHGFTRYRFPLWLSKMSRTKGMRAVQNSVLQKIGHLCHTSRTVVREDILFLFKYLFKNDRDFAITMLMKLNFEDEEIGYILDEKPDSAKVRHLIEEAEKSQEKKEEISMFEDYGKEEKEEETEEVKEIKEQEKTEQKSLGEF
ncbi:MAG: replication factor C large subunit [Candidatus Thermoplasmatota archaeon]|nr:replication factor C large subunit [Candidatus Thermoplasmatota archaeon]